jgi:hypothetical protein
MTQASIALATRVPVQLSPGQTRLVLLVAGAVLLVLLAGAVVEVLFGSVGGFLLRLAGHPPPRKSSFRMALDEMEARLAERDRQDPKRP